MLFDDYLSDFILALLVLARLVSVSSFEYFYATVVIVYLAVLVPFKVALATFKLGFAKCTH
jgi:hypothetical protein